ncbi:hypothetical protein EUX98_g1218 [Antrodiella citrinella]|uniref:M-phase inducer phosphatase n=1 Tax=Antrodiella citrinella TaxID=2447956 RepID=A0A4S4N4I6_9APHY|nr:hypothetical protein EUX98_g1218 [Antrodiella citrinella]
MTTFQTSAPPLYKHFLAIPPAPSRKLSQRINGKVTSEVEDFLSSDVERELELSFASTMSIHSPPRDHISLAPEDDSRDYVPMDISPAPPRMQAAVPKQVEETRKVVGRPRAFTSSARLFGTDMSNASGQQSSINFGAANKSSSSGTSTSSRGKKLQRSALPFEWMSNAQTSDHGRNIFDQASPSSPATDAMDVDTSFSQHLASSEPVPPSAAPTITTFNLAGSNYASTGPLSAAPTVTTFNQLFYDTMSPARARDDFADSLNISVDESPLQPFAKKRRSASPPHVRDESFGDSEGALKRQASFSSSPAQLSSPSAHKLERIASGPLGMKKPLYGALGAPLALNVNNKRPRRPVLSAMVAPGDLLQDDEVTGGKENKGASHYRPVLPPVRRAFSAMLPPSMLDHSLSSEDGSSFNHEADMSSPAQAYAKRQQVKTIRRCDGTDDFRPLTGASALVSRDNDAKQRGLRRTEERVERATSGDRDTPRSKYLCTNPGSGLGGFGDNEAFGKLLPCHRVKEDGLMRITSKTMDQLLGGTFDSKIASFQVIDCRFDYEYNGGHIPGAININTTNGVEDYLLGAQATKPQPSTSGDPSKKSILVFHCEFSHKRAPTFAKHLRSKDRAMNNHVYPRIYYPEVYILEGGYCQFYKDCAPRCEPYGYVQMDDPHYAQSRREDLDQFRKAKFGRTKSYAYGEGKTSLTTALGQKRNTAPSGGTTGGTTALFAAANAARTRRNGMLQTLEEDSSGALHSEDEDNETDLGDSPCPPPTKAVAFKGKRLGRAPLARAETYGPSRMNLGY